MNEAGIRFLIALIYILPSYVLYASLFHTVFFSVACQRFSGSFYTLFGLSTVYNVFFSLFYYLDMVFGKITFLVPFVKTWGARGFMVSFIHFTSWYLMYVNHLLNCLLAFNRLTVFALKAGYQKFWHSYLKFLLGIPILLPLLFVWHIPFTDTYVQLDDETDPDSTRYLTEGNGNLVPWMDNPRNSAILISITSTLSFGMNAYVIIKLMQQKYCFSHARNNAAQGKVSPQDIKMSIYTLLIFSTEAINCVFLYFLMTAKDFDFIMWMLNIQVYLIDISSLAPAWFVLITNKNLRRQTAYYFGFTKSIHPENSTIISVTVRPSRQHSTQIRVHK